MVKLLEEEEDHQETVKRAPTEVKDAAGVGGVHRDVGDAGVEAEIRLQQ